MADQERVSPERFEDFKEQMFRLFNELKGAIDVLSGKIDAYNNMAQCQAKDIAILATKTDEIVKLRDKVEKHDSEIVAIKTEHKTSQRNLVTIFTIVSLFLTIGGLLIAIFK